MTSAENEIFQPSKREEFFVCATLLTVSFFSLTFFPAAKRAPFPNFEVDKRSFICFKSMDERGKKKERKRKKKERKRKKEKRKKKEIYT